MADPRLVIARREFRSLRSEKTIVLALLIQLFIAAFSSFLVVGLVSLYDPSSAGEYTITVGVAGDDAVRDDLVAAVEAVDGVDADAEARIGEARREFRAGETDALLRGERRNGRTVVTAQVPDSDIRTTLVVVQLREALQELERAERERRGQYLGRQPLDPPGRVDASPYYGFTYTVLLPLLLFLPVFISGSIAVDSVTEEVERGTLELLRVAPVTGTEIVDGKAIAAAGLAPAQAVLWALLLELNGTDVAHLPALAVLVSGLAAAAVSLGAVLGLVTSERRVAQLGYSLGTLVLFGGTTLLPADPVNLSARLALGSTGSEALFVVGGYAVLGGLAYITLSRVVRQTDFADV